MNTPSDRIAPGTLCYLVRVAPDLLGRVVEIAGGQREEWGDGPGPFYDIRAPWIAERFPGRELITVRQQLAPITGECGSLDADVADEEIPVPFAGEATGNWFWRVQQCYPGVSLERLAQFAARGRYFEAATVARLEALRVAWEKSR